MWPGVSQELSLAAGPPKLGGQTRASSWTSRKYTTARLLLTPFSVTCKAAFTRRFPGTVLHRQHPLNFLWAGSLCRAQTLSSACHTCSLKMSRSNYRPLKHGIHKDSSARPLSLMLWIVSSLTVCEGCSEDYKFWEQFQFKEYSNQISKPRLCLYHSLVPSLNHYACMRLRFLKSSPVKWQVKKKKKKSRSSNTPKMWEKALYFRHLCSYTTLFFFCITLKWGFLTN